MLSSTYFYRYEKLLNQIYIEPKNKEIVGTFLTVAMKKRNKQMQIRGNKKSNRRRKKWDQGTFWICCKSKDEKRMAPRKSALALLKSNFFLYLPRVEKLQNFGFSQFFQGNDFRDCYLIEYLAGIYFREFDQNPQKLVPLRYIFQFFCEMDYQWPAMLLKRMWSRKINVSFPFEKNVCHLFMYSRKMSPLGLRN